MTRGRLALLAGVVVTALGVDYGWIGEHAQEGWRWCLERPEERDGSLLVFPLWTVTAIDDPHHYHIAGVVKDIPVDGDASGLSVGATVSVMGSFDWNVGQPIARQTQLEVHHLRRWKELLGVLGFVVLCALLPFCFVVERDGNWALAERRAWWRRRTLG